MNMSLKIVGLSVAAVLSVGVALNSFTIVQEGDVKVQSLMGKVDQTEVLRAGFHVVNPMKSFDTYSVRNDKYEVTGLNLPTQDRFNSTANVTIMYNIDANLAPTIKTDYGTAAQYIDKTLRQQLRSIIRDEGRKLEDSRSLAQSDNVSTMQQNTFNRLTEALQGTGINISEVLLQDIEFDPRIATQILKTQERIQAEEERKSADRIAATNASIAQNEALGEGNRQREAADADAYRVNAEATAAKQAMIDRATGEAEAIKLIADANKTLSASLTPQILENKRIDVQGKFADKSKGLMPHTILNGDISTLGVPVTSTK
ncbi:TMhelix containing protein [Vibrio phage 1.152.O._10N.222.46.E1]|uniref:TMhelix containing protein n=4 Tax=Nahantvirus 49C7 TaxID=2846601 RepID=A0A2I7RBF4_9CAUD|nr:TMhelix containing protein [Vibrio phage 1.025.O._10N.222.46.B6]AUR90800.1 TMhelix containing protein [Vibrio phage 1.150.O._10N.222.46.A6]AUR90973.1 TMhelix containing protein [Vibrio phage 1.152.O._10N.222.46.E1]AUS02441.1 TMhelix containing protein [Vibrio phage 2.130.O._10N.222.46.C2]